MPANNFLTGIVGGKLDIKYAVWVLSFPFILRILSTFIRDFNPFQSPEIPLKSVYIDKFRASIRPLFFSAKLNC